MPDVSSSTASSTGQTIVSLFERSGLDALPGAALVHALTRGGQTVEDAVAAVAQADDDGVIDLGPVRQDRAYRISKDLCAEAFAPILLADAELCRPPTDCGEHLQPGERLVRCKVYSRSELPAVLASRAL